MDKQLEMLNPWKHLQERAGFPLTHFLLYVYIYLWSICSLVTPDIHSNLGTWAKRELKQTIIEKRNNHDDLLSSFSFHLSMWLTRVVVCPYQRWFELISVSTYHRFALPSTLFTVNDLIFRASFKVNIIFNYWKSSIIIPNAKVWKAYLHENYYDSLFVLSGFYWFLAF